MSRNLRWLSSALRVLVYINHIFECRWEAQKGGTERSRVAISPHILPCSVVQLFRRTRIYYCPHPVGHKCTSTHRLGGSHCCARIRICTCVGNLGLCLSLHKSTFQFSLLWGFGLHNLVLAEKRLQSAKPLSLQNNRFKFLGSNENEGNVCSAHILCSRALPELCQHWHSRHTQVATFML
jgi:hypothetical protein